MLDDDLEALALLGQTKLAYTDGTPEQRARLTALAGVNATLNGAVAALGPVVVVADFSTPAALSNTVAAAGDLAVCIALKAQLA